MTPKKKAWFKAREARRKEVLGMTYSTACYNLLRRVVFLYFSERQHNSCYRCGEELDPEDWHMDHVEPWVNARNPKQLFWDVTNLAASHSRCNVKARHQKDMKALTLPSDTE